MGVRRKMIIRRMKNSLKYLVSLTCVMALCLCGNTVDVCAEGADGGSDSGSSDSSGNYSGNVIARDDAFVYKIYVVDVGTPNKDNIFLKEYKDAEDGNKVKYYQQLGYDGKKGLSYLFDDDSLKRSKAVYVPNDFIVDNGIRTQYLLESTENKKSKASTTVYNSHTGNWHKIRWDDLDCVGGAVTNDNLAKLFASKKEREKIADGKQYDLKDLVLDVSEGGNLSDKASSVEGLQTIIEDLNSLRKGENRENLLTDSDNLDNCLLVIEKFKPWRNSSTGESWLISWQQTVYAKNGERALARIAGVHGKSNNTSGMMKALNKTYQTTLFNMKLPKRLFINESSGEGRDNTGYIYFSHGDVKNNDNKLACNTLVTYTGEPYTSIESKFKVASTVVKEVGSNTSNADQFKFITKDKSGKYVWYQFENKDASKLKTVLNVADQNFTGYSIHMGEVYVHELKPVKKDNRLTGTKLTKALNKLDTKGFQVAWGEISVKNSNSGISTGDVKLGKAYSITSFTCNPKDTDLTLKYDNVLEGTKGVFYSLARKTKSYVDDVIPYKNYSRKVSLKSLLQENNALHDLAGKKDVKTIAGRLLSYAYNTDAICNTEIEGEGTKNEKWTMKVAQSIELAAKVSNVTSTLHVINIDNGVGTLKSSNSKPYDTNKYTNFDLDKDTMYYFAVPNSKAPSVNEVISAFSTLDDGSKLEETVISVVLSWGSIPEKDKSFGEKIDTITLGSAPVKEEMDTEVSDDIVEDTTEAGDEGTTSEGEGGIVGGVELPEEVIEEEGTSSSNPAESLEGYTIYAITVTDPPPPETGDMLYLEDYKLNKYVDEVINTTRMIEYSQSKTIWINDKRYTTDRGSGVNGSCVVCGFCWTDNWFPESYSEVDYHIQYADFSEGTTAEWDKQNWEKYYLKSSKSTWGFNYRKTLARKPWEAVHRTDVDPVNDLTYRFDYAMNFVRSVSDDIRTVSAIQYPSLDSNGDPENILKLQFGDKPKTKLKATAIRDSFAPSVNNAGKSSFKELISLHSRFKREVDIGCCDGYLGSYWHQTVGSHDKCTIAASDPHSSGPHTGITHPGGTHTHIVGYSSDGEGNSYPIYRNFTVCGADHAVAGYHEWMANGYVTRLDGIPKEETIMNHEFKFKTYKYETKSISKGKNTKVTDGVLSLDVNAKKTADKSVTVANGYRYAYVMQHDGANDTTNITEYFYPEVRMAYRLINGRVFETQTKFQDMFTMGEVKRKLAPSSLYLYRVRNTNEEDGDGTEVVHGTTYSEGALQGGSANYYNSTSGKVVIPGGTDVSLKAEPKNIKLDLYGYALDVIDISKDNILLGTKVSDGSADRPYNYNDIVASSADVYSDWGNEGTAESLFTDFKTWVADMVDVTNYQAEVVLNVKSSNQNKTYNNFSSTIGNITKGTETEEGVYPIHIEHGDIVRDGAEAFGYQSLIEQIAKDYVADKISDDCKKGTANYQKAEEIFEASGIYTAILEAIESDNDDFNKSIPDHWHSGQSVLDKADFEDSSALGNDDHWYDEETRTFVIRRYHCVGNQFHNVTLQDKIDYGVAENITGIYSNVNGSGTVYADAEWYLSIYLGKKINGINPLYDAKNRQGTEQSSVDNYSMIMRNLHVVDADFSIPNSTTSNFGD